MIVATDASGKGTISGTFLVDAHVHCHDAADPAGWLDHAAINLKVAAAARGLVPAAGWLLFTEMAGDHVFATLQEGPREIGRWRLEPTHEAISLIALGGADFPLVLVAGRQVVTTEGLEILALGSSGPFADGESLTSTMSAIQAAGGHAVLPWGFGKWWGRRGAILRDTLERAEPGTIFLGDNGGRPALAPLPRPFALAAARGIFTLPGSDPLPLAVESGAVGRYGLVLEGAVDGAHAGVGLLGLLRSLTQQPETFGRRQALAPFVARQIAMQRRKRIRA